MALYKLLSSKGNFKKHIYNFLLSSKSLQLPPDAAGLPAEQRRLCTRQAWALGAAEHTTDPAPQSLPNLVTEGPGHVHPPGTHPWEEQELRGMLVLLVHERD